MVSAILKWLSGSHPADENVRTAMRELERLRRETDRKMDELRQENERCSGVHRHEAVGTNGKAE